jgi:hypothetical protein
LLIFRQQSRIYRQLNRLFSIGFFNLPPFLAILRLAFLLIMPYIIAVTKKMGNQNEEVSKEDCQFLIVICFLYNLGEKNEKYFKSIVECSFCVVNNLAGQLYDVD